MTEITADVAIVGGGIMGCSAAIALRRAGLTVVLLEKGACGAQASGINAGGVRQQGRSLPDLPISRRAVPLWYDMHKLVEEDIGFRQVGHIRLAQSDEDFDVLEKYAKSAKDYGLNLELIGRNGVRDQFPWLGETVIGASYSPECGLANPRLVTPALARKAQRMGVVVHEFCPVEAAQWTGSRFAITTPKMTVKSTYMVNATGAWASPISKWFNEHPPIVLRAPNLVVTEPVSPIMNRSVAIVGGIPYFRQVGRGNIVLGGGPGWGDMETEKSRAVPESSINAYRKTLNLVPALKGVNVIRTWSGLEADMPDRLHVLDFSQTTPNLVHAFGFSGHGFQLGPAIGEIIGEMITDGASSTPIEAFRISRFAENAPTGSAN